MVEFPRDFDIGHPYDDNFEETIVDIVGDDDVKRLHEYLKVYGNNYYYPAFLDICLRVLATKCALHIIEGKLPHGPPILAADHCEPKPRVPVLYRVIYSMCDPHVFHLLLTDCKAANQVQQPLQGLLPLHWLLDHLSEQPPLSEWSLEKPLSTLIDSLYVPQLRPKLECARMLAQHTPSLDQIALGFILNQEIIHLAALLLVAPFTPGDFETIKTYTSIASQAIHGQSITPATYCADALLYIFEKDGDKLTSKFNIPQEESAQAAEGDQSVINRLIRQPQERVVQVSKGGYFSNLRVQQMGNINFARMLCSTSSQMTDRTRENEMMCREDTDKVRELFDPDANLSSDHYQLLHSLLNEDEGNDTIQLLQANLSRVNDDATEHFKSCDARQVNLTYMCLLHRVLGCLVKYDYLSKWSPGQSLVKLILLLFLQHELRPTLECVQLIAKRINSVNEVARKLIQQGELLQLAGLLLVAREKAMEPFDSGDTIKEDTSMENVSLIFHGKPVTTATVGAAGLFEIFDKAGDALAEYWSLHDDMLEPVEVLFEVAERIQHSGIQVLSTDVDLTDIYSDGSFPESVESICDRLGIDEDDTSVSGESPFPSVQSVKDICQPRKPASQKHLSVQREYKSQTLDKLGTRAFSTSSRIVERVSRGTMKHSWASPSPSLSPIVRDLAYLAMKLKRGVRLV